MSRRPYSLIKLFLTLLSGIAFLGFAWLLYSRTKEIPFSKERWAKADQSARFYLARSLRSSKQLVGLTPVEVKETLGTPNGMTPNDVEVKSAKAFSYLVISPWPEMPYFFHVHFQAGKASRFEIND